jgi:aminopeptidase N
MVLWNHWTAGGQVDGTTQTIVRPPRLNNKKKTKHLWQILASNMLKKKKKKKNLFQNTVI